MIHINDFLIYLIRNGVQSIILEEEICFDFHTLFIFFLCFFSCNIYHLHISCGISEIDIIQYALYVLAGIKPACTCGKRQCGHHCHYCCGHFLHSHNYTMPPKL